MAELRGEWVCVLAPAVEGQEEQSCCLTRWRKIAGTAATSGGTLNFKCEVCGQNWSLTWTLAEPSVLTVNPRRLEDHESSILSMPVEELRARMFDMMTLLWHADMYGQDSVPVARVLQALGRGTANGTGVTTRPSK